MTANPIRHHCAILLIGAAMALVVNPVLHAFSHDHFGFPVHVKEFATGFQWTEQDLCPYCDAVSQFIKPSIAEASIGQMVLLRNSDFSAVLYPNVRLRLSTRLRAPPFLNLIYLR